MKKKKKNSVTQEFFFSNLSPPPFFFLSFFFFFTSDLSHIPHDLKQCLDAALSQEPNDLEQHLPFIRDAILQLLQGLKRKQALLHEPAQSPIANKLTPSNSSDLDMMDPNTQQAFTQLREDDDLAKSSSIRKNVDDNSSPIMPLSPNHNNNKEYMIFLQWMNRTKRVKILQPLETMPQLLDLFRCTFKNTIPDNNDAVKVTILDNETNIMYDLDDITSIGPNTFLSLDALVINNSNKNVMMDIVQQAFKKQFDQWTGFASISTNKQDTDNPSIVESPTNINSPSSPHVDTTVPDNSTISQQVDMIQHIRKDFDILQKAIKDQQQLNETMIQHIITQQKEDTKQDMIREPLQEKGQALTNKMEALQDTIDDMKQDVTQRRCRPSPNQLEYCHNESKAVQEMIQSLGDHLKQSKPQWKKAWEEQLQRIVAEQQCVKEYEHLVMDLEEDHLAIEQVLQHLTQVSELQKRHTPSLKVHPSGGSMGDVFQQLQTIDVDHEKRLDALAQAEKRRARDMANRIDDFEKELIMFVDKNKLKKTGGAEQLERQQQQKTRQLLMDLYDKDT
ncbi:actin interacting protein 3-domain-containing protein [Halteromyces radiatus]|uniref:actin interacting protein 3-domain-containing protein n=1 Tax=Halteromyces radiatus TaxID=101107 RepID=UPI00221FE63C|nr:actin interacting protein 3-domain-containing protein [Halteromyces radiatus]KAI8100155.1 actin interacting protein 3-domain-containing protein [Halteromyces radiatus]